VPENCDQGIFFNGRVKNRIVAVFIDLDDVDHQHSAAERASDDPRVVKGQTRVARAALRRRRHRHLNIAGGHTK